MIKELPVDRLHRTCDPSQISCKSSSEVRERGTIIGQPRAVHALKFGLGIKEKGFNVFVSGMPGTGRTTTIGQFLEEIAKKEPTPHDWCYVHNFRDPYQPNALKFPAGMAVEFRSDMVNLVQMVSQEIRNAFESEQYSTQREGTIKTFQQKKQELLDQINTQAMQQGFSLQATPVGLVTIPIRKGKPLSEEEYMALTGEEREALMKAQQAIQAALDAALHQVRGFDKGALEAIQKLDQEVAKYAIGHLFKDVEEKYQHLEEIREYLEAVLADILANLSDFKPEGEEQQSSPIPALTPRKNPLRKYAVNVLVDNSACSGAPVVLEMNPTYANLLGRIEQEAQFGALSTDFTLVRRGSLHQANGGYLVLPVEEVLRNPLAWESLKRALENKEISIEDVGEKIGFVMTKSLKPEPIPLDVKVILIGRPDMYPLLLAYDEQFNELFKVKADFDIWMERNEEHIKEYTAFTATLCDQDKLVHLDATGIGKVVEYGSRLAEDQTKLSTRFGEISDVIREASYYARRDKAELVTGHHITQAIDERFYRSNLIQERIQEMISRGTIKIDVDGEAVGQVNGLSVIQVGDVTFGQPNRITVSIGLGREGLIDIEREAKLGGPLHTKGVLILSGYIAEKYTQDKPLNLSARLVFEQNYSGVDGDSASSTELYAILSALSSLPIKQGIAVTGSVNQKGEVQAIGGVNEKIEGFFETCQIKGLTGEQGVIIPESNVDHLMLKDAVLEAVKESKFHVWPVKTIEEGIEILTGVPAGKRMDGTTFEQDSVHGRVNQRLHDMASALLQFGKEKDKGDEK